VWGVGRAINAPPLPQDAGSATMIFYNPQRVGGSALARALRRLTDTSTRGAVKWVVSRAEVDA